MLMRKQVQRLAQEPIWGGKVLTVSDADKALVAGVGMIPFTKPGASENYDDMAARAVRLAIEDAGLAFADLKQAYAGYVYGDSTCGQKTLYRIGMTGISLGGHFAPRAVAYEPRFASGALWGANHNWREVQDKRMAREGENPAASTSPITSFCRR